MSNKWWALIVLVLLFVIAVLSTVLFYVPTSPASSAPGGTVSTSTGMEQAPRPPIATSTEPASTESSSSVPLSASVYIETPKPGETVGKTFTIAGTAPSGWFFEAVFPIQVRDANGNVIANTQGSAQADWTAPGEIPFTATTTIDNSYSGPATLILLKNNPSGLPENDDSVSSVITIKQ